MREFFEFRFWPLLLKTSWQAAVLIVLMLIVRRALGRRLGPRWRYGLWLLVVLRLALPWTVPSTVSLFNLVNVAGHFPAAVSQPATSETAGLSVLETSSPGPAAPVPAQPAGTASGTISPWHRIIFAWLPLVWAAGALTLALYVLITHYRLAAHVTHCRPLVDSQVMNLLEDCKQRMRVRVPVTLVETATVDGPCLLGFLRPRLLLPPAFTRNFSLEELRFVFLHELGHVKRHDIPLGWLMAWLQILHWFNPLVWLAFARMRMDRELACDALALTHAAEQDRKPYGLTMVKLLESFGEVLRVPGLAGIVEDKQQMKERITMIAKFQKTNRGLVLAGLVLVGLGLLTLTDAQPAGKPPVELAQSGSATPRIIATSPLVGAKDVDPALTEIKVTFDQDMGGGMSWTGGGADFPKSPEGAKAHWLDKRTCVLPVKLEAGHYYRVGINSQSYRNFRTAAGSSAIPSAIYFTTRGAGADKQQQMDPPRIVSAKPAVAATEVDPALTEITVTFDQDMGGGMSWTGGGPDFPKSPEGAKAHWLDKRTCVLPVELEAAHYYRVGINSKSFQNFANEHGVAALPSAIFFATQGASKETQAKTLVPQVVHFEPANGAQDVSPALTELRVTFSVPMGGGCSWCTVGDDDSDFPPGVQGKGFRWTDDKKTGVLPVALKPGMTYRLSLNAPNFKNFQSEAGVPLEPVIYTFKTSDTP